MTTDLPNLGRRLRRALCDLPSKFGYRYSDAARQALLNDLFWALTNDRRDYFNALFPRGFPKSYKLQDAQGVQENAEYTAAARGHPCGHIFKSGEASYHCSTCTDDTTAVLCSRCFVSSNHEGHQYTIGISAGNSGCCDCGDEEAWKRPVNCAIHTATGHSQESQEPSPLVPTDLQDSIRTAISTALDYFCDVISCSPENLRMPKTVESVTQDEIRSRLRPEHYLSGDEAEVNPEFCLIIWNDEKHTVREVQSQVARACREREKFGLTKAEEANDIGRSVVRHSRDLGELTKMAKIIEEIKITVTIRSSRDTFREQMCGTIIDWLADIATCTVANDSHILRRTICEEMLQLWRIGGEAWNAQVGREELDDHGEEDDREIRRRHRLRFFDPIQFAMQRAIAAEALEDETLSDTENDPVELDDDDDDDIGDDDADQEMNDFILRAAVFEDGDTVHVLTDQPADTDATDDAEEMDTDGDGDNDADAEFLDVAERMDTDQASPPPPPLPPLPPAALNNLGPDGNANYRTIPRTPSATARVSEADFDAPNHWLVLPQTRHDQKMDLPVYEDLTKNIRVDSMILFDLRLWKLARTSLRDLFIGTLVNIPQFKRILGLRFSGLYTTLAQLYLVADREPDHSIINLSLQLLTTPSITEEVIERGNFLTNLMAILYTFLTTRQVGYPADLNPAATLGFDAGSVANRRLYHFFSDLRYFLGSPFVQSKVRNEPQYLFQYLDLAKLSQGICPNIRAIGDHVEYETDAWISASLLTRDINKLCRQYAEAYYVSHSSDAAAIEATCEAIKHAAGVAIINSVGLERRRFSSAEIKEAIQFHYVGPFGSPTSESFSVPEFALENGSLSFHHPLHYTLSWLLECGKDASRSITSLRDAAQAVLSHLHGSTVPFRDTALKNTLQEVDDVLLAMFDFPLRVCAWLAQMRANLWVRNGMSLRHQMVQYKSVAHRDVGHHRDLFLLQVALVACDPARVLASIVDRFGLTMWYSEAFKTLEICEDNQMVDLAEDFIYLLINLLSDRDAVISDRENVESQLLAVRKDIAHTLCFKPLSYSDLCARLTERAQDHEHLEDVLDEMTRYRAPEGLHDSGLFELKEEFLQELDPYNSHFTKNQRDEAENIYKQWMAKKMKKSPDDIVLEPKLRTIQCEAYRNLCAVVHTPLFADIIHRTLFYVSEGHKLKSGVSTTRVEAFLHILLQLVLIATLEDCATSTVSDNEPSFVRNALSIKLSIGDHSETTVTMLLHDLWQNEQFSSCRSKVRHILRLFNQKWPHQFLEATKNFAVPAGRFDTASPANSESEIEAKKKQATERKARVMAQFQQQQQSFMDKQGVIDWGDDELDSPDDELPRSTETRHWKYPSGLCIQCREDTSDSRLYGTFAMVTEANVLRQTKCSDDDFVAELLSVPENLDRSIEHVRPFGVSGANHLKIRRLTTNGQEEIVDHQGLGKGWPQEHTMNGPVSTSCGHIMHFSCFENYFQSVARRHTQQVARNHPERIVMKEFVCPLCKALANTFLPILWKHSQQAYPGPLSVSQDFETFMSGDFTDFVSLPSAKHDGQFQISAADVHRQTLAAFSNTSLSPAIARWQAGELTISPTSSSWNGPDLGAFKELANIYTRLRESFTVVSRTTQENQPNESSVEVPLNQYHLLVGTLANTIASVEIGHRGREAEFGTSLLTSVPQQTLSHLQILSSTLRAYAAVGPLTERAPAVETHFQKLCERIGMQLAGKAYPYCVSDGAAPPLLVVDGFQFLVQTTMVLCPVRDLELRHVLQLSLTSELLRVVLAYTLNSASFIKASHASDTSESVPTGDPLHEAQAIRVVVEWLGKTLEKPGDESSEWANHFHNALSRFSPGVATSLFKLCKTYALAFLRKAAIFFHVAHGIDFPTTAGSEASLPELERLSHFFQLPDIAQIFGLFHEYSGSHDLKLHASNWIIDALDYSINSNLDQNARSSLGIRLLHPAPLELIGLPKYFDVLMEESHKWKCPTTGKEVTDPALCLFCGEIFCSQTVCCLTKEFRGGCNAHLLRCSSPIGMFLFIRKCHVALLHVVKDPRSVENDRERANRGLRPLSSGTLTLSHGSFFPAPYLTKHGETDSGLRSKHQLILNQKRYDKLLRDTWLMTNGSVWSTIARKLESEVNAGGWETL